MNLAELKELGAASGTAITLHTAAYQKLCVNYWRYDPIIIEAERATRHAMQKASKLYRNAHKEYYNRPGYVVEYYNDPGVDHDELELSDNRNPGAY